MTEEKKNELFDKYLEGVDLKYYPYQESIKFLLFNAWLSGLNEGTFEATKELQEENQELKEVHESDKRSLTLITQKGVKIEKRLQKAEQIINNLLTPAEFATLGRSNSWIIKEAKDFLKE